MSITLSTAQRRLVLAVQVAALGLERSAAALALGARTEVLVALAKGAVLSTAVGTRGLSLQAVTGYFARVLGAAYESEATASDYWALGVTKGLAESVEVAALVKFWLARPLGDSASAADVVALAATKGLGDAALTTELVARATTKRVADIAFTTDTVARTTGKALADPVLTTELVARALTKVLADGIAITDLFKTGRSFQRNREDQVDLTDATALNASTPGVADGAGATDEIVVAYLKFLADSGAFSDHAVKTTGKAFSHAVGATDTVLKSAAKALGDSATAGDAGWLVNQDYALHGYFAEDYVGQYRAF